MRSFLSTVAFNGRTNGALTWNGTSVAHTNFYFQKVLSLTLVF